MHAVHAGSISVEGVGVKHSFVRFAVVVFVLSALLVTGCTKYDAIAEESAQETFEQRGLAGEVESSSHKDKVDPVGDGEPTNHQRLAMWMLSQAGHDSDLSSYDRVDLVDLKLTNGEVITTVVIDEGDLVVFPQNVEATK